MRCAKATPPQARVGQDGLGFRKQWTMYLWGEPSGNVIAVGDDDGMVNLYSDTWHVTTKHQLWPVKSVERQGFRHPSLAPKANSRSLEGKTCVSVSTVMICAYMDHGVIWYHDIMISCFHPDANHISIWSRVCLHLIILYFSFDDWRHAFCLTTPLAELCSGIVATPLMPVLSGFERSWWAAKISDCLVNCCTYTSCDGI